MHRCTELSRTGVGRTWLFVLLLAACKRESTAQTESEAQAINATTSPSTSVVDSPTTTGGDDDSAADRAIVVVTIDGVRHEDIAGTKTRRGSDAPLALMPKTRALAEARGVVLGAGGESCGVVHPDNPAFVSLPGYMEILSGRRTNCLSNRCPRIASDTVLDDVARDSSVRGSGDAASISSWTKIRLAATSGAGPVVVSAGREPWRGRPADDPALEEALRVVDAEGNPFPGTGLYRRDEHTTRIALAYLRADRPRLLHVGLGDTDEYGHRGQFRSYAVALRMADLFVADVAAALAETATPYTVVVTTDHGRAKTFRDHGSGFAGSERSFVVVFGDGHAPRGIVCEHRDIALPDIGATLRVLAGLSPDEHPASGEVIDDVLPREGG